MFSRFVGSSPERRPSRARPEARSSGRFRTVDFLPRLQAGEEVKSDRAKEIFEYIAPGYGITLEEWNHDIDHVHVLFRAQPKSELSKFINAYKSASSRLLKQEYPRIRQKLWKEYFWSRSFCLLTTGGAPLDVIRRYIESQGERTRT